MRFQATEYPKSDIQQGGGGTPTARTMTVLIKLLAILAAGLLIGVLVGCASLPQEMPQSASPTPTSPAGPATPSDGNTGTPNPFDAVAVQTRHFIGEPNAPVTIIEFGDFQ